jgi:hypothetical protein
MDITLRVESDDDHLHELIHFLSLLPTFVHSFIHSLAISHSLTQSHNDEFKIDFSSHPVVNKLKCYEGTKQRKTLMFINYL